MEELLDKVTSILSELHTIAKADELSSPIILTALRQRLKGIAYEDQIDMIMQSLQADTALTSGDSMEVEENGQLGILQTETKT
jgi:hypothetical protein